MRIGVDFGGVLSIHDGGDRSGQHGSTQINIPGAITALQTLKAGGHQLYLISFCGRSRAVETRQAIDTEVPGLFEEQYYVKDKKFKSDVCRRLGIDVMIDDRLDILVPCVQQQTGLIGLWYQGDPGFEDQTGCRLSTIVKMKSWDDKIWNPVFALCQGNSPDLTVDLTKKIY